jgi:hypothetical protein
VHYIETLQSSDCTAAAARNLTTENYRTPVTQTAADTPLIGITTTELEAVTCHGHTPRSTFDAADAATVSSSVSFTVTAGTAVRNTTAASQHEDWNIRADKQDKPGYIAGGISHSILIAHMHCSMSNSNSKHVVVAVTYLKSYAGVGALHVYGKQQHSHIETPALNLRGSNRKRQLQASNSSGSTDTSSAIDLSSDHVIDALDTAQHASPYQTKYMKLDQTYFTNASTAAGTQLLENDSEQLSAVDVPLITSGKAAAAANRGNSNANTSDYSDTVRQDWKFKLVRLSCC